MHAIIATRLTRFDASNQATSIAYSSAGTATMCALIGVATSERSVSFPDT